MILPATDDAIITAASYILSGEAVGFPTETCYGIAVDALSPTALELLVKLKLRPPGKPISVLVSDESMLERIVRTIPPTAKKMIARYWPGPLTLVLPAKPDLPEPLIGPQGGVAVRISSDPIASKLVRSVDRPITATSANRSGEPEARVAVSLSPLALSCVLDDGVRTAPVSTIVEVMDETPKVLRQGVLQFDDLE